MAISNPSLYNLGMYCQTFASCPRISCKDPSLDLSRVDESLGHKAVLCMFTAPYEAPPVQDRSVMPPVVRHPAPWVYVDPVISPCVQQIRCEGPLKDSK